MMNNSHGGSMSCNLEASFFCRLPPDPYNQVYAPDPEEVQDEILDKLEQSGRVPSKEKFRRMACMTFIFTGACPYNDRCVFLHDFRVKAEGVKVKTTRQVKPSNLIKDTFYWPDMNKKEVIQNMDSQGLTDVNQRYQIPDSFGTASANFHNRAIYSLWSHFVAFCMFNRSLKANEFNNMSLEPYFQQTDKRENRYVRDTFRLPVFFQISNALRLDTHNISLLEEEYNREFSTPDKLDAYFDAANSLSGLFTDVPRFRTPADAPSLLYGANFTAPTTLGYEEQRDKVPLRRTESVASIMGATHRSWSADSEQDLDVRTVSRRHSFSLENTSSKFDSFGSSVQRSLFAATPQKANGSPASAATPNMFESSTGNFAPESVSIWSSGRGISTLDIDLIYSNKSTAAAMTCVDTVRSASSHLMKGTMSSDESDERDRRMFGMWKDFDVNSGCETTSSEADIASSMTWCNPSLDLGEQSGFSPYVAISSISATNKSEWPSSTAAASFDSNMRFTPRDTGSVQLLVTDDPMDSSHFDPATSGPSTMSGPNTASPLYLDSGDDDPLHRAAFSPLQTEESIGARSAFGRSNAPERRMLLATESVRKEAGARSDNKLSFETLFPQTPMSFTSQASSETAFHMDNFARGGLGDSSLSGSGSGSGEGFQLQSNQTALRVMSSAGREPKPHSGGFLADHIVRPTQNPQQLQQSHLGFSQPSSMHLHQMDPRKPPHQNAPPSILTPLDRSLFSHGEHGESGRKAAQMPSILMHSFPMQRQMTPQSHMAASPATPVPTNAFQEDMQRLQLKSLEDKKAAAAAANAVLSRSGGAFSTPTKDVRVAQQQDWASNHYLTSQPQQRVATTPASAPMTPSKAQMPSNSSLRITASQELARGSQSVDGRSSQVRPWPQQIAPQMHSAPQLGGRSYYPQQQTQGPLNQAQLQQQHQMFQHQQQYQQQQVQFQNQMLHQHALQQQWASGGSHYMVSPPQNDSGVARAIQSGHYNVEPPQDFPPPSQVQHYGSQPPTNHRF